MSVTEKDIEQHLHFTRASSIGDTERLAGINTFDRSERVAVWDKFSHLCSDRLPGEPSDPQCAAVMRQCRRMAARMVNSGRMCLVPKQSPPNNSSPTRTTP
ncbi:hypothetical protein [Thiobacillus denitrificans]|uniref:hypothetical protein n=1 Tax=Thiobacillus denitrificans TaxID=36861 RepID=UPI000AD32343|nr:hypothetical protein [Thiobacillus denitrificans]